MAGIGNCLKLFADETRIRILHLLMDDALTVAEIQEILQLRQSSASSHLAKLKQAGLIYARSEGSSHRYALSEGIEEPYASTWTCVAEQTKDDPEISRDRESVKAFRERSGESWVDASAGRLRTTYAPGRTWESLCHGLLHFAHFGSCADIGHGDGALLDVLAPRCSELHCIDPSTAMLEAARSTASSLALQQCHFHACPAEALDLTDNSVDTVLFLQSLHYIDEPQKALAEANRILKPGGKLLILTLLEHEFEEARRYGHKHFGFSAEQLQQWCPFLSDSTHYALPQELQAPRFQSQVFYGEKA